MEFCVWINRHDYILIGSAQYSLFDLKLWNLIQISLIIPDIVKPWFKQKNFYLIG